LEGSYGPSNHLKKDPEPVGDEKSALNIINVTAAERTWGTYEKGKVNS